MTIQGHDSHNHSRHFVSLCTNFQNGLTKPDSVPFIVHSYMARYLRHAKTNHQAAVFSQYSTLPLNRSSAAMINVRDAVTWDHVDDGLPAQYVVHHADCRLYWTAPMITDVTTVWKAAADVAFNSAACVAGGMRPTPASSLEPTRNAFVNLLLQISYFFTSYVI